jgi:hypothetical protein
MTDSPMYVGSAPLRSASGCVSGEFIDLDGERFYRIACFDRMPPFFMSIVSASNHWMFISSLGGLTAGRQNADNALFPYYTEDRIHDDSGHTGSRTIIRVQSDDRRYLWEPLSPGCGGGSALYRLSRNLFKNVCGNKLVFEENNHDLGLSYRYTWTFSDRFGFVKHAEIRNLGDTTVQAEVLDGIENILPWGLSEAFQNTYSVLGDAYKQNEIDRRNGLATFALSSRPGDSPEPSEALRATVCWSSARAEAVRLLSSLQLNAFRRGEVLQPESRVCGRRGAYFVCDSYCLEPDEARDWLIVADLDYGLPDVARLEQTFREAAMAPSSDLKSQVLDDVDAGSRRLTAIVGSADGLQLTGDSLGSTHHFANVLFNVMRGGVFESGYAICVADLKRHVQGFSRSVYARCTPFLDSLGEEVALDQLCENTRSLDDPDLLRLVTEYLPISFSRRHGDPSRPWNKFSINVKHRDGSKILDYQGNWRDIFQNWEALSLSFPGFLDGMIARFLNCSTADGYNPYRVTREGYDWEAPDPDDPWAHFGYWGDHQLVYLLKLLEQSRRYFPMSLQQSLHARIFVYADVPYDIKPYADLLADPRASIVYNREREAGIRQRIETRGLDGLYQPDADGACVRVNLAEKLLVPLLAKVSNFVPGAGFWMNTQRPEWNDANNALAGYGASMVTLYYARRYIVFVRELLAGSETQAVRLSVEVADWLAGIAAALDAQRDLLEQDSIDDRQRKTVLDALGGVAERYRRGLYAKGLGAGSRETPLSDVLDFLETALAWFDHSIGMNRRAEGLYHAYNVLVIGAESIGVERLQPMLEGQVAVLSAGTLSAAESCSVLQALRDSDMYRADQHSYMLYPDRTLPGFLKKNTIAPEDVNRSSLLQALLKDGNDALVELGVDGAVHFNGTFRNVRDVHATLETLAASAYRHLVDAEAGLVAELFESVFSHSTFTGRSGTFYGYEGLGSIYWHMVSKLLLATQENALAALGDDSVFGDLAAAYYDVRAGIGFNKSPDVYGAFPTDPYSHTPGHAGARQPGMTGQVKEEIITRFAELGVVIEGGCLIFRPALLRRGEFLDAAATFEYFDVSAKPQRLVLEKDSLAFTYCQVPIRYRLGDTDGVKLLYSDGREKTFACLALDLESSQAIFRRRGAIAAVSVTLRAGNHGPHSVWST